MPVLANLTEFGLTPFFTVAELGAAGVKLILYPLSAFRAMSRAALASTRRFASDGTQSAVLDGMQTRDELYDVLDYHAYERKLDELFANDRQARAAREAEARAAARKSLARGADSVSVPRVLRLRSAGGRVESSMSSSGASSPRPNKSNGSSAGSAAFAGARSGLAAAFVGSGLLAAGAGCASSSGHSAAEASAAVTRSSSASPNNVSAIELEISSIDFATAIARIVCVCRSRSSSSESSRRRVRAGGCGLGRAACGAGAVARCGAGGVRRRQRSLPADARRGIGRLDAARRASRPGAARPTGAGAAW